MWQTVTPEQLYEQLWSAPIWTLRQRAYDLRAKRWVCRGADDGR